MALLPSAMPKSSGNRTYLYLTIFSANLFALLTGISVSWTSPAIPRLQNGNASDNPFGQGITISEASWLGGIYSLGGIFGPLVTGYFLTKFGRKISALFCCGIMFSISFFILSLANTIYLYYLARFIMGIAASCTYSVIPVYNGEVAETSIRGKLCASISTFETCGELLCYVIGPFLTMFWFHMALALFSILSTLLALLVLPESPFYLILKEDVLGAEKSLMKLRATSHDGIQEELRLITSTVKESQMSQGSIKDIFKSKGLRKAQVTIFALIIFQVFSGIVTIMFYCQSIFEESGSKISAEYSAMVVGATKVVSSFIAPNCVDRLGRRPMLIISGAGMFTFQFILGSFFFLKYMSYNTENIYWLPIVCLVATVFFFILGLGPLVWTILGEIIPSNMKSSSTTLNGCFYFTLVFFTSKMFELISSPLGISICFWFFAGCCFLSIIFVLTYLIETKGKTLQEIQDALRASVMVKIYHHKRKYE